MSRPREFDEEAVLERALELFWRDGYAATSLQALLTHMGISRQSLYNTFGDKRRLFLAALDRYADLRAREMLGDLEHEDASLSQVFGFFERLGQNAAQKGSCGAAETHPEACLIGRSCMELGAADPEVAARVHYFFDRTVAAFRNALDNAVRKGEVEPLDTAATARHLTATLNGLGILHRAGVAVQELGDVVRVSLSVLKPKTPAGRA
jgi:TetR/AcrR family transcriptional repressor of nem operon